MIHHTNCGMEFFTDDVIRGLLASSLETAALGADGFYDVGTGPGSAEGDYIDWLTIPIRPTASPPTSPESGTIRSSPPASRSTGTSSTSRPDD